jgi:hypothetical protein
LVDQRHFLFSAQRSVGRDRDVQIACARSVIAVASKKGTDPLFGPLFVFLKIRLT